VQMQDRMHVHPGNARMNVHPSRARGREPRRAKRKMRLVQVRMHVHLLAHRGILGIALIAC